MLFYPKTVAEVLEGRAVTKGNSEGNRSDPSHFFTQQEEEEVHPALGAEP